MTFEGMTLTTTQLSALTARFGAPEVRALLLVGSYARDEVRPVSDIDLLRLVEKPLDGSGSHLWQRKLVNVSDAVPAELEARFSSPGGAIDIVPGLRSAHVGQGRVG